MPLRAFALIHAVALLYVTARYCYATLRYYASHYITLMLALPP